MNWARPRTRPTTAPQTNGIPFKHAHADLGQPAAGLDRELAGRPSSARRSRSGSRRSPSEFPNIDYIEVVNEPLHDPPRGAGNGNYIEALGGNGATGWDWIIESFRMARQYFPNAELGLNEFSITNNPHAT